MSQPPQPYSRVFDFTAFSVATPSAQQPGNKIDQELNAVLASLNATIARLSEAQRDDGKIRASALDVTEFEGIVDDATQDATQAAAAAQVSAGVATVKASEASASASAAASSAASAALNASQVASQVAAANTAAANAGVSAAESAASAASALTSKNSAFASASSATSSAGAAAGSAGTASSSASNAAVSASNASASAVSAAGSASSAATQAAASANSAVSAAASATAAANSAASINPSAYAPAVHTHTIAQVTGLQAALNGKAASSHTHGMGDVIGLFSYLDGKADKTMAVRQTFESTVYISNADNGKLITMLYNSGTPGVVGFIDSLPAGSRIEFYQADQTNASMIFTGAFNRENKMMTQGPNSQVTALKTLEGWLIYGDLQFLPNGTLVGEACVSWQGTDALGVFWDGMYMNELTFANGSGGTYTTSNLGGGSCFLPYSFCTQTNVEISSSTFSWSGCSYSGTATYSSTLGNVFADGYGGTYNQTLSTSTASYGDLIYDNSSSCLVKHDGMGGYFVEDNSGSGGNPSYGSYLGNFSGDLFVNVSGNDYLAGSYTEDRYADGNGGVAYTQNRSDMWYGYGTNLGYDSNSGQSIYADGGGSYYLS